MKNISGFIILILVCFNGCKTSKPVVVQTPPVVQQAYPDPAPPVVSFSDQSTWLLGYFNLNQLAQPPHSAWYLKGFDEYQFNAGAVNRLLEINTTDLNIKIVMGTWCPDSRREVPRFMKILNACKFPLAKVQFIGVDNVKQSPVENYEALNIERVPTFIVYKNNIEAGRIIENPTTSLEQDMVNILTRNE